MQNNQISKKFNFDALDLTYDRERGVVDNIEASLIPLIIKKDKTLYEALIVAFHKDPQVILIRLKELLGTDFRVLTKKIKVNNKDLDDDDTYEVSEDKEQYFLDPTIMDTNSIYISSNNDMLVCGSPRYFGISVLFRGINEEFIVNIGNTLIKEFPDNRVPPVPEPEVNTIYTLIKQMDGLRSYPIGEMREKFIPENYIPEVITGYNDLLADFQKTIPGGRLAIIDGPAGSGKTHLVNSLISKLDNHLVLLASRSMISEDFAPQLTTTLLEMKEDGKPFLLVIEDGDQVLVPRSATNMDAISSLLNLTDGIMGSLLDLRIIVTTNAEKVNIDPAFFRPGRLSQRISVPYLPYEMATSVLQRLSNDKSQVLNKTHSLAEIYQMVRDMEIAKKAESK